MALNKEQKAERDAKILFATQNLIKDDLGKIKVGASLKAANLSPSAANKYQLYKALNLYNPYDFKQTGSSTRRNRHIGSMHLGENAKKLGWAAVQGPALYAVVCRSAGRAYIGSSLRPDLRRAVHLYWLKNQMKWGCSNIFFGNKKLAADIAKYGVEDFYFEILQSMPGATSKELKRAEIDFLNHHGLDKAYNRFIEGEFTHQSPFSEVDEECKRLEDEYHQLRDDVEFLAQQRHLHLEAKKSYMDILKTEYLAGKYNLARFNELQTASHDYTRARRKHFNETLAKKMATSKQFFARIKYLKKVYAKVPQVE